MARENTLNVSLTPPLQNYVRSKVKSGLYESASEVIRDSLRALQERELAAESYWADIRAKVQVARRQVKEGKILDGESVMDQIISELRGASPRRKRTRASR